LLIYAIVELKEIGTLGEFSHHYTVIAKRKSKDNEEGCLESEFVSCKERSRYEFPEVRSRIE
jgi:hypothetical protein